MHELIGVIPDALTRVPDLSGEKPLNPPNLALALRAVGTVAAVTTLFGASTLFDLTKTVEAADGWNRNVTNVCATYQELKTGLNNGVEVRSPDTIDYKIFNTNIPNDGKLSAKLRLPSGTIINVDWLGVGPAPALPDHCAFPQ